MLPTQPIQNLSLTPSPRQTASTPIKTLHWPKFKTNSAIVNSTKERPPFAITSEKWQKLYREKEEKKL